MGGGQIGGPLIKGKQPGHAAYVFTEEIKLRKLLFQMPGKNIQDQVLAADDHAFGRRVGNGAADGLEGNKTPAFGALFVPLQILLFHPDRF